jgi:hypothetical protein
MGGIKLIKSELIKQYLYLKFDGDVEYGSAGNEDCEFIIKESVRLIKELGNIQALIFDFKNMNYVFGNRFMRLFEPNVFGNNKTIFVSVIIDESNADGWRPLIEFADSDISFFVNETSVFQNDIRGAIRSVNKRMNSKG